MLCFYAELTEGYESLVLVLHDRCFSKKLNYDVNKIAKTVRIFMEIEHIKNRGGHILARKNWTTISHAMERSRVWSKFATKLVTAP